jgi:hypothetical protein
MFIPQLKNQKILFFRGKLQLLNPKEGYGGLALPLPFFFLNRCLHTR